jgi:SWIM zinc finger
MNLTVEQVMEMAPDPASAAAGKKLVTVKLWSDLGCSPAAIWGKCQGSALYQVKIDLANMGTSCSCPSRKFPCKHALGLLMLAVESPAAVVSAEAPEWVEEWLQKRRSREDTQSAPQSDSPKSPADGKARLKRAEQRTTTVRAGLERLDLWMKDLVRTGLASVESKPASFWEEQSKRLVDAQAPGLASRIARLAEIPRSSPDWVARLLDELGRVKLLVRAFERSEELDPALLNDVRQILGWNVGQEELEQNGEPVQDSWIVAGQWVDDDERVRAQRSWVVGRETRRVGLVLQFAAGSMPFADPIVPGTEQRGTLVFYPGAARLRAKFSIREGLVAPLRERPPGHEAIPAFLNSVTDSLARQPWLNAFGAVLHDVTLVPEPDGWWARDRHAFALPLGGKDHWKTIAVTGGRPFDLTGEWDGRRLRMLSYFVDGEYGSG